MEASMRKSYTDGLAKKQADQAQFAKRPTSPFASTTSAPSQPSSSSMGGSSAIGATNTYLPPRPAYAPRVTVNNYTYDSYRNNRASYYSQRGWSPPSYIYQSQPSFGMWDAMFMWMMLDNLNDHNNARFAYNNAADPGYQQWRAEANRMAADNAELKAKLAALDSQVDALKVANEPVQLGYVPPDVKPEVALAAEEVVKEPEVLPEPKQDGGFNWWWLLLPLGVGAGVLFFYTRDLSPKKTVYGRR